MRGAMISCTMQHHHIYTQMTCCAAWHYTRSPLEDSRLFGPSPWKISSHYLWTNGFLSNPAPGENLLSGNLVMETGCTMQYHHIYTQVTCCTAWALLFIIIHYYSLVFISLHIFIVIIIISIRLPPPVTITVSYLLRVFLLRVLESNFPGDSV